MTSTQDASITLATESTYRTAVTTTRALEYVSESLKWTKGTKQGKGLRVGGRVARSGRRVVPTADGQGDIVMEATSKGMGVLWNLALGSSTSTLVSGSTYQQVHSLGDTLPSATIQRTLPEIGGTLDPYTFLGCQCSALEVDFPNSDILSAKFSWDIGDVSTSIAYAAPSYASAPNLFHFANASIQSGTLTAPTSTALASGGTTVADVRGGSFMLNHALTANRQNLGGGGRKQKPTVGLRALTGKLDIEYDSQTFAQAFLADSPMSLVVTYTAGALSTGVETLQFVIPEIKFDSDLPNTNGTDLIVQGMGFTGLDNLSAAQPIWVVCRTSDTAL